MAEARCPRSKAIVLEKRKRDGRVCKTRGSQSTGAQKTLPPETVDGLPHKARGPKTARRWTAGPKGVGSKMIRGQGLGLPGRHATASVVETLLCFRVHGTEFVLSTCHSSKTATIDHFALLFYTLALGQEQSIPGPNDASLKSVSDLKLAKIQSYSCGIQVSANCRPI